MRLWRNNNILLFTMKARLWIFLVILWWLWAIGSQTYRESRGGDWARQDKIPQNFLLLLSFICFPWISSPRIVASLWSISRFQKKLFLEIFASLFIAFREEKILEDFYSVIFVNITLCRFSSQINIWLDFYINCNTSQVLHLFLLLHVHIRI